MDDNPPTPFYVVRKILETELGGPLGSHFSELSRNACDGIDRSSTFWTLMSGEKSR